MSETPQDWFSRWKAARKRHYSSAEKLLDDLRDAGHKTARSTVLAWEGVPAKKSSYPGADYRTILTDLNSEFAELIAEVDERERAAAGLSLAGLAQALAKLEETVGLLEATVSDQDRRLAQLEQLPVRRATRPAGGAPRR